MKNTCVWLACGLCVECPSVILMPCCQSAFSALCLITRCWLEDFSVEKSFFKIARMGKKKDSKDRKVHANCCVITN